MSSSLTNSNNSNNSKKKNKTSNSKKKKTIPKKKIVKFHKKLLKQIFQIAQRKLTISIQIWSDLIQSGYFVIYFSAEGRFGEMM